MSQKTIAQLKTDSNNTYTDNTAGDIAPSGVRTLNTDWLDSVKPLEVIVSANKTAILGESYVVVATATFTDPTPTEGKGFTVFVRNGTATVGGVAYDTAGTTITRIFHSGSWKSYVSGLGKVWTPALTVDGTVITGATLSAASVSYNGNTGTCSLFFDTIASDFSSGTEGSIQIADSEFPIPPTEGHIVSGQFYIPVLVGIKASSGASLRINLNDPTSTIDLTANQLSIVSQFQI
jgi:hypothetical protein